MGSSKNESFRRLPRNVWPTNYRLTIEPDLREEALNFKGTVEITLKAEPEAELTEIKLNVGELDILKVSLFRKSEELSLKGWKEDPEVETLTVFPEVTLRNADAADLRLEISYFGVLSDKMRGFFRTLQVDGNPKKYGAACHFEPAEARKAFPCWDEPKFRATYDISLILPKDEDYVALSNMPEKSRTTEANKEKITFETTPSIPSYLVCFCVGHYDFVEAFADGKVKVRVYTPVGKSREGKFALDVGVKALEYYKEFFGVEYKLPKMDMIAISNFFTAMENWGLLTFKETLILFDPDQSSAIVKENVASVVAHEIAHQWFGDLVTVDWWTHLWLKEGYATWIQHLCAHHLHPEWSMWTQFLTQIMEPALEMDCLANSHPIEVEVNSVDEIGEIFDAISYNKGSSIIRMLFNWIGEDSFRKGMKNYLNKFAYSTAKTEDLWAYLGDSSKLPVKEVMSTWTKQKGYPLISFKIIDSNKLEVTQRPFPKRGEGESEDQRLWMIPLRISCPGGKVIHQSIISKPMEHIQLNDQIDIQNWVNLNPSGVGYYRVKYPPEILERLISAVEDKSLEVDDRLMLIENQLALVMLMNENGKTRELMRLVEKYRHEDNYSVWSSLMNTLGQLRLLLQDSDLENLDEWIRWLLQPQLKRLGFEGSGDHRESLLRSLILRWLVKVGDQEVIDKCYEKFKSHLDKGTVLEADLEVPIFAAAVKKDLKNVDVLMKMSKSLDMQEKKQRVYAGLCYAGGCKGAEEAVNKILEFSMSESDVLIQDTPRVFFSMVSGGVLGRDITWKFFKDHVEELSFRYRTGMMLAKLVSYVTNNFGSEDKAEDVETFFAETYPLPAAERTIKQALEIIRIRASWRENDLSDVQDFLREKKSS